MVTFLRRDIFKGVGVNDLVTAGVIFCDLEDGAGVRERGTLSGPC